MKLIARLLITILAILLVAYYIPGIEVAGFYTALIVALLLGILNVTLKPILVVLTLPVTILTLGLFIFIINAGILWFIASFVDGFTIDGFWWALLGTLAISAVSWLGYKLID